LPGELSVCTWGANNVRKFMYQNMFGGVLMAVKRTNWKRGFQSVLNDAYWAISLCEDVGEKGERTLFLYAVIN
jgi:hypothetical protein